MSRLFRGHGVPCLIFCKLIVGGLLVLFPWKALAKAPHISQFSGGEPVPSFRGEGWLVTRGKDGTSFVETMGEHLRVTGNESSLRYDRSLLDSSIVRKLYRDDIVVPLRTHTDTESGRQWVFCRMYGEREILWDIPPAKLHSINMISGVVRFNQDHDATRSGEKGGVKFRKGDIVEIDSPAEIEQSSTIKVAGSPRRMQVGWLVAKGTEGVYARETGSMPEPISPWLPPAITDPNGMVQAEPGEILQMGKFDQRKFFFKTGGYDAAGWKALVSVPSPDHMGMGPDLASIERARHALMADSHTRPCAMFYEIVSESLMIRIKPDQASAALMPLGKGSRVVATGRSIEQDGRMWAEVFVPEKLMVRVAPVTNWKAPQYAGRYTEGEVPSAYIPENHPLSAKGFDRLMLGWGLGKWMLGVCESVARENNESVRFRFRLRPTVAFEAFGEEARKICNNVPDAEYCDLTWIHRGRPLPLRKDQWVHLMVDERTGGILCVYSNGWEIKKYRKGLDGLVEVVLDEGIKTGESWIIPDKLGRVDDYPDNHVWMYEDFGVVINAGLDAAGSGMETSRIVSELWKEERRFANEVEIFDLDPGIRRGGWKAREDLPEITDDSGGLIEPKQKVHEPG